MLDRIGPDRIGFVKIGSAGTGSDYVGSDFDFVLDFFLTEPARQRIIRASLRSLATYARFPSVRTAPQEEFSFLSTKPSNKKVSNATNCGKQLGPKTVLRFSSSQLGARWMSQGQSVGHNHNHNHKHICKAPQAELQRRCE